MMLGKFLRVPQRFEIFHGRLDKVWCYRFNSLMNSSIDTKFGGMMHSACTMKQIAVWDGTARPILRVPWNFEIFHDRLGPGLRDDVIVLTT